MNHVVQQTAFEEVIKCFYALFKNRISNMSKNLQFFVFGIVILGTGQYYQSPFGLIGLFLILWPAIGWLWKLIGGGNGETQLDQWLKSLPETKYKYGEDQHGIALDEASRELHLFIYGYAKTYPFSDIREWTTNVATGGKIHAAFGTGVVNVANSFSVGSANRAQEKQNQEETGLFITVRDVNTPVWRVRFSKNLHDEARLQRQWMEILRQVIKGE